MKELNISDLQGYVINGLRNLIFDYFDTQNLIVEFFPPTDESKGDITTNFALKNSKILKKKSMEVAQQTKDIFLKSVFSDYIRRVDIVPPGFINVWYSDEVIYRTIDIIIKAGEKYGEPFDFNKLKVLFEFVSANPTGPLTIAHARQAAVGDTLVRMFRKIGCDAFSEYYLNDRGVQIRILGLSVYCRYMEKCGIKKDFPENGYRGQYIIGLAEDIYEKYGEIYAKMPEEKAVDFFSNYAYEQIFGWIKNDLKDFRVNFDSFFSEKEMEQKGEIKEAINFLIEKGFAYKKDGALWFKTTEFGDEKDRVLVKSDGTTTYLASDIPYHWDKIKRGYDLIVDIVGPDHHGYIDRLKAAVGVLSKENLKKLKVLIVQLTTLYKSGVQLRMSTRAGEFISLREIIDEIGVDASRYFFISRKPNSHLDFDLEIAKKKTPENPVFYVQYAYARTNSLFRKYFEETGEEELPVYNNEVFDINDDEKNLIKKMLQFPEIIKNAAYNYEPQRLTTYLEELAGKFHSYYNKHKIIDKDNLKKTYVRLIICKCINIVIKNGLDLIGVSAPDKM